MYVEFKIFEAARICFISIVSFPTQNCVRLFEQLDMQERDKATLANFTAEQKKHFHMKFYCPGLSTCLRV